MKYAYKFKQYYRYIKCKITLFNDWAAECHTGCADCSDNVNNCNKCNDPNHGPVAGGSCKSKYYSAWQDVQSISGFNNLNQCCRIYFLYSMTLKKYTYILQSLIMYMKTTIVGFKNTCYFISIHVNWIFLHQLDSQLWSSSL